MSFRVESLLRKKRKKTKKNLKDIWFKQMLRRRLETAEDPEIEFMKNNSLSFDDGQIIGQ